MPVSKNNRLLDYYLSLRTYIEGNRPSQADVLVFNALKSAPTKGTPNLYRWYTHIQSFGAEEREKFAEKSLNSRVAKFLDDESAAATAGDDNDVDPLRSDEKDAEADRNEEGRLKADSVKNQNKPTIKPRKTGLVSVNLDDNTDANAIESHVRSIEMPGLLWGDCEVVSDAYELLIRCVIQDTKVNMDYIDDLIKKVSSSNGFHIHSHSAEFDTDLGSA